MKNATAAEIIANVIQRASRPMPRTKLVKLIYLLDEQWYWLHGKTATGWTYVYDQHGPNAASNSIVTLADELAEEEVAIEHRKTRSGADRYAYSPGTSWRFGELSADLSRAMDDLLSRYGRLSVEQLVAASKQTRPFQLRPNPGDKLQFSSARTAAKNRLKQIKESGRAQRLHRGSSDAMANHPQEPVDGFGDRAQKKALETAFADEHRR